MFSNIFKKKSQVNPQVNVYSELRNRILNTNPKEINIIQSSSIPNVWGVLMEFKNPQAVVTLVSLADGTTSLYFSNGGGFIGSGEYPEVVQATKAFISTAEKYIRDLTQTASYDLPAEGRAKFYVLTFSGVLTIDVDKSELVSGQHEFSPFFYAGNAVIHQIRLIQENK